MATFKQYEKKDGTKLWLFKTYLGTDPVTGKEIRTTRRNFKTKKEAQLALSRLQIAFSKERELNNNTSLMTFERLYNLWFEQHQKSIKATTKQRIKIYFELHILKDFGSIIISKITPLYCQKVIDSWAETLVTFRQMRIYTKKVFDYGILIGALGDNPMDKTIIPRQKKEKTPECNSYYTKDELKQFFDCAKKLKDQRAYTFFRVLAFVGLRKGEAQALLWKDIDFQKKTITINKTLAELQDGTVVVLDTKTQSSNRTITVDNTTLDILKKWKHFVIQEKLKQGIRDNDLQESVVFCNLLFHRKRKYLRKNYANEYMARIKRNFPEMKIITVHGFRKTNASLLFESGASIKDVSQRLGHKSTNITMDIYIKVTQAKQDKTTEDFAKYMAF